jgi:hypothetical protein
MSKLLCVLGIILIISSIECIKVKQNIKKTSDFEHRRSIKIVNYALDREDRIEIARMPVKNLKIKFNDDWLAKALWTGDNYNQTGFSIFEQLINSK